MSILCWRRFVTLYLKVETFLKKKHFLAEFSYCPMATFNSINLQRRYFSTSALQFDEQNTFHKICFSFHNYVTNLVWSISHFIRNVIMSLAVYYNNIVIVNKFWIFLFKEKLAEVNKIKLFYKTYFHISLLWYLLLFILCLFSDINWKTCFIFIKWGKVLMFTRWLRKDWNYWVNGN